MSDPILHTEFASYFVHEKIGSGGMARVYKAFDQRRQQIIALKIMLEHLTGHEDLVQRFEQEAKIVSRLRHPNIVEFYDYGQYEGIPFIVMEYMSGGTLADRFRTPSPIKLEDTVQLLRQVAGALDYAHSENVVHRDLKLSNILLDSDGRAALSDFGIARVIDATGITMTGHYMPGTAHYMSPEQVLGNTDLDYHSDLYSFAIIGYLLATGRYPFTGTTEMIIMRQHLDMAPPLPSLISPGTPTTLNDVLLQGLSKEPDERFASATAFVTAFTQAVAGYGDVEVTVNPRADNVNQARGGERYPTQFYRPGSGSASVETSDTHSIPRWQERRFQIGFAALALLVLVVGALLVTNNLANNTVALVPTVTPAFTPVDTIPAIVATNLETETGAPSATSSPIPTTSLAASATFTDTSIPTPVPVSTTPGTVATPVPFGSQGDVLAAFRSVGTLSNFDCWTFLQAYHFLETKQLDGDIGYTTIGQLIDDPDDPIRQIYDEYCGPAGDSAVISIPFPLFSDMYNELDRVEDQIVS